MTDENHLAFRPYGEVGATSCYRTARHSAPVVRVRPETTICIYGKEKVPKNTSGLSSAQVKEGKPLAQALGLPGEREELPWRPSHLLRGAMYNRPITAIAEIDLDQRALRLPPAPNEAGMVRSYRKNTYLMSAAMMRTRRTRPTRWPMPIPQIHPSFIMGSVHANLAPASVCSRPCAVPLSPPGQGCLIRGCIM